MANIKFLKYTAAGDFDASQNKEYKPPVRSNARGLMPLLKGKTIDYVLWLGTDEQVHLFHLLLNDGSSLLINQGSDGAPQVIHKPSK